MKFLAVAVASFAFGVSGLRVDRANHEWNMFAGTYPPLSSHQSSAPNHEPYMFTGLYPPPGSHLSNSAPNHEPYMFTGLYPPPGSHLSSSAPNHHLQHQLYSSYPPRWNNMIGKSADQVKQEILKDDPSLEVVIIPYYLPVTKDYNPDRVRIFVDFENKVVQDPYAG